MKSVNVNLGCWRASLPGRSRSAGFTLIELVVVIILLGVLAAVAVPKFAELGRAARVASIKTMAGALETAANQVHAMCALSSGCDYANPYQTVTLGSRTVGLNYGWPGAGDHLNGDQIDTWITYEGFSPHLANVYVTEFRLPDAPDPANCSVGYQEALSFWTPAFIPTIATSTAGC